MGPKAAETTHNINTFGPGSTYKGTVQWWCKKFCKGDKSLKGIEHHGQPKEADDQLRGSLKLILLQLQEKFQKNTLLTILWSCSTWTKLERWKSSISGYLMSWPQIKKKTSFWIIIFSCMQQQWTISVSDSVMICDKKWILYDNWQWQTEWLDLEEAPKSFPKPNLHQNKIMVTVWWSTAIWFCCQSDPIQRSES